MEDKTGPEARRTGGRRPGAGSVDGCCGPGAALGGLGAADPDSVAARVQCGARGGGDGEHDTGVASTAVARALACFLDEGFELGDALVESRLVGVGGAWRCDDGHGIDLLVDGASISGILRIVKVDRRESTELHEQVAAELRRAIAEGEAKRGERLPPARDLAAVLEVNTITVLRALRELRDEGLLEFRRGRGITVAGTPEKSAVVVQAKALVEFARSQGYRVDELVEIIQTVS